MTEQGKRKKDKQKRGRLRKIHVAALNLVLHPHPLGSYVQLLTAAYNLRSIIPLRANTGAMLGTLSQLDPEDSSQGLEGEIHKFARINLAQPWLDMTTGKEAAKSAVSSVHIPEHLKPNFESFRFVFIPKSHTLYFVSKSSQGTLSPSIAKEFFTSLFASPALASFGHVRLTVIPIEDSLERIVSMAKLRTLSIEIHQPNPDDLAKVQAKWEAQLRKNNAQSITMSYVSASESGLVLDNDIRSAAKVAANDGVVKGSGRDNEDKPLNLSTDQHPKLTALTYYDGVESVGTAIMSYVTEIERSATP